MVITPDKLAYLVFAFLLGIIAWQLKGSVKALTDSVKSFEGTVAEVFRDLRRHDVEIGKINTRCNIYHVKE